MALLPKKNRRTGATPREPQATPLQSILASPGFSVEGFRYSFLILKIGWQITKARVLSVLVGKYRRMRVDRPFNAEVWVIPENTGIMTGTIVGGYFVENLGLVFQGSKTVQKTRWHPHLRPFHRIELDRDMPPIGWGPVANVHGNIEDRPSQNAHQFTLGIRWLLKMEAAHRAFLYRGRLIILNKGHVPDFFAKQTITPGFLEMPSDVAKPLRNNQLQTWNIKLANIHLSFATCRCQAERSCSAQAHRSMHCFFAIDQVSVNFRFQPVEKFVCSKQFDFDPV